MGTGQFVVTKGKIQIRSCPEYSGQKETIWTSGDSTSPSPLCHGELTGGTC